MSLISTGRLRSIFWKISKDDVFWRSRRFYSITTQYARKSPVEHILLRPETYIGSTHQAEHTIWSYIFELHRMELVSAVFPQGLIKIFDEILVNAADNKQRDPKMTEIKVDVDRERNTVSIWNNGSSLPIEIHPSEGIYVSSLVFGHLFTSSNYDDTVLRTVGGRNGFGAKLCNVFSKRFTVETGESHSGRRFTQTWRDNMKEAGEAVVVSTGEAEDFTRITFEPDLAKFGMVKISDDVFRMFLRRAVDVAGTVPVDVYFNGQKIEIDGFNDYISLFADNVLFLNLSPRWKVGLAQSNIGFSHVSFVNSIFTSKGGKHVELVANHVVGCLKQTLETSLGGRKVRPSLVSCIAYPGHGFKLQRHLLLFVNSLIDNPAFESQTKEVLCTPISKFEPTFHFEVAPVLEWAESSGLLSTIQQEIQAKRPTTTPRSKVVQEVAKLEDAVLAGTSRGSQCSLLVTEGDSAKAFAVSGLEVLGRDRFGVFPIRGKLINVADVERKKVTENVEIENLMRIIGLKFDKDYSLDEEFQSLRYGQLVILADQDEDGSHIKGLLLNFFHHFWPELLKRNFISAFRTPLIKARRGTRTASFFSTKEFEEWKRTTPGSDAFAVKYYKGLGTSTSSEAREYFRNIDRHLVKFSFDSEEDGRQLWMAFNKNGADERKAWIEEQRDRQDEAVPETGMQSVKQFVDRDLLSFSLLDLRRSIPSVVDGLKPSQRKIINCVLQQKQKKEIKVNQLAGAVSLSQGYHHGEESLVQTITKMAQNFPGSNNINLLQPIGQFGTRHEGGEDAARGRYIYTAASPVVRSLFPKVDDDLLTRMNEDGQTVEPLWFCPVVPLILINGALGIGTGWSAKIYPHRPLAIIDAVRRAIEDKQFSPMDPWWRGFKGTMVKLAPNKYMVKGSVAIKTRGANLGVEVTELPVGIWTNKYKEKVLLPLIQAGDISGMKERHTEREVRFELRMKRFSPLKIDELRRILRLTSTFSTNCMNLFDSAGVLRHYASAEEVLREHFLVRRDLYEKRLTSQISRLDTELNYLQNQLRFVRSVVDGSIVLSSRSRLDLETELQDKGFSSDPFRPSETLSFSYLLEMPLVRLTTEEIQRLEQKSTSQQERLATAQNTSWQDTWTSELDTLARELKTYGLL